uniref:Toxin candidate TRINITY_DN19977_c1_g1_i1.p1 n=1 Tax=Ceriantheomorphe brasiliensis TaxID=1048506 RepID=A0A7G7WYW1_9CNID|nr:toxin candidate TRINITY_DN19977_c1_g1_i1.p1 [Ceriantheomorphe brasiliensis]
MARLLLMFIAVLTGHVHGEKSTVITGTMNLPYEASMNLGYFFNVNDMTSSSKSPFTSDARENFAVINHDRTSFLYKIVSSSKEKRDLLDISGSLSLKIKALGGIDIAASGKYLKDKGNGNKFVEILVVIKIEKQTRTLTSESEKASGYVDLIKKAAGGGNFHYVRSETYGGELIASLKFTSKNDKDIEDIEAKASLDVKSTSVDVSVAGSFKKLFSDISKSSDLTVTIYKTGGSTSKLVKSVDELNTYIGEFLTEMKDPSNHAKLRVSLLPIQHLVPTGKVISGIQFILDRTLEASTARFESYYDDVKDAKELARAISKGPFKTDEQKNEFDALYSEVSSVLRSFVETIRTLSLNQGSTSGENTQRLQEAIAKYNEGDLGQLPGKYVRAVRRIRDSMGETEIEASKPGLLRSQLKVYRDTLESTVIDKMEILGERVYCGTSLRQFRDGTSGFLQQPGLRPVIPGYAMNLYGTDYDIPENAPIPFDVSDRYTLSFNTEMAVPVVSSKKRSFLQMLSKKRSSRRAKMASNDASPEVPLYKDNHLVAPMGGVYLLSYQLYNIGDVTEVDVPDSPCDQDWQHHNEKCYLKVSQQLDFATAENNCINKGAELVSINNEEENTFAYNLIKGSRAWIGLKRQSGGFVWKDGTTVDYDNWYTGEPNNAGGRENCVHFFNGNYWNDLPCDYTYISICEKDKRKNVNSKGLVRAKVMKGDEVLSEQRVNSQTPEDVAGSTCDAPFIKAPISKPVLVQLASGDRVRMEQTVNTEVDKTVDVFYDGVLLKAD